MGQENVIELQKSSLGAEDFAEFLNEIPGAMFRLGVSTSNGCAPLHSSKFDPDERAIAVGIKVITESIVQLNNEKINKIGKWILIKDLFYLLWLLSWYSYLLSDWYLGIIPGRFFIYLLV